MKKHCNSDGRHYWYGNGKSVKKCIKKNEYIKEIRQKIAQEKLNRINIQINKE